MHVITPPHVHVYEEAWTHDENQHWKKATCEHTEEKGELGDHNWVDNKVITQATTEAEGEKEQICSVCGKTRNVTIPKVASLELLDGFIADKTYDKDPIGIDKTKIRRIGSTDPIIEEEIKSILYKQQTEGDEEYDGKAPSNAGKYTVKVTTVATTDHKESEVTKNFEIKPIVLVGTYSSGTGIFYNGKENERTLIIGHKTCPDILEGDYINLSAKFPKDVGENKDQEAVECTHTGNFNYSIDPSTFKITAEIYPKEIKTAINATKVYDAKKELVFGKDNWNSVSEIEEIDKSSLQLKLTLDSADVGKPKVLESKLSSPNYKLANDIVITAEITQKELTLKDSMVYIEYANNEEITIDNKYIKGFVGSDSSYGKIIVTMTNKSVGASYKSHKIDGYNVNGNNYSIKDDDIRGKVSIIPRTIKIAQISSDNVLSTIYLPLGSSSASLIKERKIYLNGPNNDSVYVTISSNTDSHWAKNSNLAISNYKVEISDKTNYNLVYDKDNTMFKVWYSDTVQDIQANGVDVNINGGSETSPVIKILKFTPISGTKYQVNLSNTSHSAGKTMINIAKADGTHYYSGSQGSSYSSCIFTALDSSEHYIFVRVYKTCSVKLAKIG